MATQQHPPHIGKMIKAFIEKHRLYKSPVARDMKRSPSEIGGFLRRGNLTVHSVWEFSLALDHNFFADLAKELPVAHTPGPEETAQQTRIAELKAQVKRLTLERDVLKEAYRGRG